ncbi:MAG: type II/IV secretion system ATPase subunit [Chloroflexi bacterium]|nr:type II/IV secretion system ATPase subunit [Chloroflexota bacterium]
MGLPFPIGDSAEGADCRGSNCMVRGLLPDDLQEQAEAAPHLMEYLHCMPIKDVGVPDYYETLDRRLNDLDYKNLIYRVTEELFVHIYPDPQDARDYYISIEPAMLENQRPALETMERRLLDYVEDLAAAETDEEKKEVLARAVEENTVVIDRGTRSKGNGDGDGGSSKSKPKGKGGFFGLFSKSGRDGGLIEVTAAQQEALKYTLVRDKLRMGALEPVLQDPHIEDISCSGIGPLFIEHKIFDGLKSNISFDSHEVLDDFILRLAERIGKPVTFRDPIVDATLLDGSRINIVFGSDVSKQGSNFSIRKFMGVPMSILDIAKTGALNYKMAAYLSLMVGEGMNIFISGETASGKTTIMNALTLFVRPNAKIVSIEDTPELQVPHPNWIREVVRGSLSSEDSSVSMFGLLKAALRQRPNLIIIGEIRGEEGAIAFQAMQTGHPVISTFHASSVEKLIQRMTGHPINVPKVYIDNLNVVVIASSVRLPNGRPGRRIMSINELVGYDSAADAFSFVEVFRWNSAEDIFEFTGHMNSYLLETKVAPKRGFSSQDKRGIYKELDRRAALFERLADQGTTDFYELYKVFSKAQREGLL